MKTLFICLVASVLFASGACADELSTTIDPMYLGVGARPLGMGKSYVAVAEGAETLFLNPAGLGKFSGIAATSLYTNLLNESTYMVLAGGMPVSDSAGLGGGVAAITIGDIGLYDSGGNQKGTASYVNGVAFISAGVDLEKEELARRILQKAAEDMLVGASLKVFFQNSSGSDLVKNVNGSGLNMDIGVLYKPETWYALGLNAQNAIPSSMGAKLTYANGVEEEMPMVTKLGSKFLLLGPKGIVKFSQVVDLAVDADVTKWGTAAHVGAEYEPNKWLKLRAGIDQDSSPVGVATNFTAGIGFNWDGFSFDYAYHPYGEAAENATHFFSISYIGENRKGASAPKPEPERVSSTVNPKTERAAERTIASKPVVEPPVGNSLSLRRIMSRGELAKVLVMAQNIPVPNRAEGIFKDVPASHPLVKYIEAAKRAKLIMGYPDRTFRPEEKITKAEAVVILARFEGLEGQAKELQGDAEGSRFTDIDENWAAGYILAADSEGLLEYLENSRKFYPNAGLTPGETTKILSRTELMKNESPAMLAGEKNDK